MKFLVFPHLYWAELFFSGKLIGSNEIKSKAMRSSRKSIAR